MQNYSQQQFDLEDYGQFYSEENPFITERLNGSRHRLHLDCGVWVLISGGFNFTYYPDPGMYDMIRDYINEEMPGWAFFKYVIEPTMGDFEEYLENHITRGPGDR